MEQWPPVHGLVRAEIFMTGYVFRQIDPANKDLIELTYLVQADPKVSIRKKDREQREREREREERERKKKGGG